MRKLLIACLNLLLVFNSIGFQAINATEVDPPNEETYEPSLPTEETNSDDSIKENTDTIVSSEEEEKEETNVDNTSSIDNVENNADTDLPSEDDINTVDDSISEETVLEINDSFEDEQISTVTTRAIAFLDKEKFKNTLPNNATNLYFGTKNDYDLSKCTKPIDLGNNYSLYSYKYKDVDKKTELIDIYVICENGSKIFFPKDSSNLFSYRPLKQITFKNVNTSYVTDMSWMFRSCTQLTSLDLSNFNTDNVTSMTCMFDYCIRLTSLNLSSFNTQNVTSMAAMFRDCESLTSLDLSNFNTNNVEYFDSMFENCKHLTSLDLLRFNTQNVVNLHYMFKGCWCLNSLDLSNFNTDKVVDMTEMFGNCYWLTSLNLSSFNTQNVISMAGMFEFCYNLPSLDLSSFNTQNVTDTSLMFKYCKSLHTIYVTNSFIAPNKSNNMFIDCYSLMGEQGTKYDLSKINGEYAHIDGGSNNPGYFSSKHTWDSGVVTTEPTCVNKGIKTFKCTTCNTTKTEDIAALGHDYSTEWTIDVEPTCTKEGSESHHCTRCDAKTGDRPIAKTAHTWDSGVVTTEPTCVNKGIKTFKCTQCDATKTEDIAALGHSYTAETIKMDALKTPGTCTDKAIYYKSCERCGQVDTDENNTFEGEVDSTNHEYSTEWTIDVEPTCTNAGSKSHHCTRKNCTSKSDITEIPMTGHTWDEGKITTEPTCINKGTKTFTCTTCNTTKTEDIAALGHSYTAETIKADALKTPGTCTDKAIYYKSCERCGQVDTDENNTFEGEVDSTNHNYSDWKITKNPTCTETGSKEKTCSRCNNKIIEELSALGHEYSTEWTIDVEPTCTNAGSKSHHCTRKNCTSKSDVTEIPMTEHAWDEGKVTTEPTCVNKGIKTFKCTQCDATKTEDIAALGHELTHVTKKDATTEEFGNIEYWNCSKCKKNFSDSEGTNEITGSTVIPKLAPSIIKGDNQTVTEKEEKALSVTSNASYDDFIEVKVDGTTLDISKYAKAKGSTIITLNADYVSTLSVGAHTLDVVSKFGTATAHFKIEKKVEITPTPETNKSSTTDKTSTGWDDGGPFTTDKCGNVFDRWNNKIYEANGCNIGGYNLVRTSVED